MNNNDQKQNSQTNVQTDRRRFFASIARAVGVATFGGLIWSAYVDEITASELTLRPPGALKEKDFLASCIKCGMCVEACPFNTLKLANPGDHKPLGTPYFIPREIPCYMCTDIPCVPVCPSGALNFTSVSTKGVLDINKAKMGIAVVDIKNCIAYWGIQCDACYRACPLLDKAIKLEYSKNERTGKHAYLKPIVDSDFCTGCGLCEKACVTEKAAIFILPREVGIGKAGDHYIKGWDESDDSRIGNIESEQQNIGTKTEQSTMDKLNNSEELLND